MYLRRSLQALALGAVVAGALFVASWFRVDRATGGEWRPQSAIEEAGGVGIEPLARFSGGRRGLEAHARAALLLSDSSALVATWSDATPLLRISLVNNDVLSVVPVGRGPGEMLNAAALARWQGDSMVVADLLTRSLHIVDTSGALGERIPLPVAALEMDLVTLPGGDVVVTGSIAADSRVAHPMHLIRRDGSLGPSFGGDSTGRYSPTPEARFAAQRQLAVEPSGTVLSVRSGSYVIERWTTDGASLGRWDVAPEWFSPINGLIAQSHEEPPPPRVMDLQVDSAGFVWVVVLRAGEQWRRGVSPPRRPPSLFEIDDFGTYVDAHVEVFEPRKFERVASTRFPVPLRGFAAPGVVFGAETTDDAGNPTIEFYRVSLSRR